MELGHFIEAHGSAPAIQGGDDGIFHCLGATHPEDDLFELERGILQTSLSDQTPFLLVPPTRRFSQQNCLVDLKTSILVAIEHCQDLAGVNKPLAAVLDLMEIMLRIGRYRIANANTPMLVAIVAPHQRAGHALSQRYNALVILQQQFFFELATKEILMRIRHLVTWIAGVIVDL